MKKAFVIIGLIIVIAGVGVAAWILLGRGDDAKVAENTEPQGFPVQFDASAPTPELVRYESEFGGLAFEHPSNWNVTKGADNSEEEQLFTVESPLDANEFYFCLDLHAVSGGTVQATTISDAEIMETTQLESGRHSIIYRVEGLSGLQWAVADEVPEAGATEFTSEITNQSGDSLQVYGRFNCRETEKPDITTQEFQNSQLFSDAKSVINSLEF